MLRTISSLVTLVTFALLARILEPRDIGVFEIGMIYVGLGFLIGEGGLVAAIIKKRQEVSNHELRVVHSITITVGSCLSLALFFGAPWISRLNQLNESEQWVLRALAPLLILTVLPIIPRARLARAMRFDINGWVDFLSNIARGVTAITIALILGGPWALVLSALAQATVKVILFYIYSPGIVGFAFNTRTIRQLISYGSQIQAAQVLNYIKEKIPVAIIGPTLGPAAVALYQFAYTYARIPSDAIGGLARVNFRAYAMCEPGSQRLTTVVRSSLRWSILLGTLVLGVLVAGASLFIPFIYSTKWLPATPIVWALIPYVLAEIGLAQIIAMAQGQNRPDTPIVLYIIWSVTTWVGCMIVVGSGSETLAWVGLAQSISSVLVVILALFWVERYTKSRVSSAIIRPIIASTLSYVLVYFILSKLSFSLEIEAIIASLAFISSFGAILFAIDSTVLVKDIKLALGRET